MRLRTVFAVLIAVAAAAPASDALARTTASPGPVSPALIRFLNSAGTEFRVASRHAYSRISKRAASGDAVREAPWRHMTATGISLIRLAEAAIDAPAGSLAWLVSLEPLGDVHGTPGPGAPAPAGAQTSPDANYFVVAVTANTGHFIAAAHGFTSP